MGFLDDVDHEITRQEASPPPVELEKDAVPRLVELSPDRLAVLHEFDCWTFVLLRDPGDYQSQRERLRQAILRAGEAQKASEWFRVVGDRVRPDSLDWEDFRRAYPDLGGHRRASGEAYFATPEGNELCEELQDSLVCSYYEDEDFACLLYEQARRPILLPQPHGRLPEDIRAVFERDGDHDPTDLWLYRGRAVITTAADWDVQPESFIERKRMVAQHFADSIDNQTDDTQVLLARLPDVSQRRTVERIRRACLLSAYPDDADGGYDAAILHMLTYDRMPPAAVRNESTKRSRREPIPPAVRNEVWRRDQGHCVLCGSQERLEYDHIIPISRGGANTARNIQLLCEPCNRKKGARI